MSECKDYTGVIKVVEPRYAIVNKDGDLATTTSPTPEEAKSKATQGFMTSWETARGYGYRVAEVHIRILDEI